MEALIGKIAPHYRRIRARQRALRAQVEFKNQQQRAEAGAQLGRQQAECIAFAQKNIGVAALRAAIDETFHAGSVALGAALAKPVGAWRADRYCRGRNRDFPSVQ